MKSKDKFDKRIICEYSTPRLEDWKQFLTPTEQAIFYEYYYLDWTVVKIANVENYSEAQAFRILKRARKKIFKHIP